MEKKTDSTFGGYATRIATVFRYQAIEAEADVSAVFLSQLNGKLNLCPILGRKRTHYKMYNYFVQVAEFCATLNILCKFKKGAFGLGGGVRKDAKKNHT